MFYSVQPTVIDPLTDEVQAFRDPRQAFAYADEIGVTAQWSVYRHSVEQTGIAPADWLCDCASEEVAREIAAALLATMVRRSLNR